MATAESIVGRAVLVLALGTGGAAFALEGDCASDLMKFCSGATAQGQKLQCLKEHRSELTPKCRQELPLLMEKPPAYLAACRTETSRLCGNVRPNGTLQCLKSHMQELSSSCREEVAGS